MARKAKGEGTISKMKDGSYCGRLTVGYDDNGKQKRKAFYGKTKQEVIQKMNAAKEESDKENFVINPDKITVGEWLLFWVEKYKKRSVRLSTYHLANTISNLKHR